MKEREYTPKMREWTGQGESNCTEEQRNLGLYPNEAMTCSGAVSQVSSGRVLADHSFLSSGRISLWELLLVTEGRGFSCRSANSIRIHHHEL